MYNPTIVALTETWLDSSIPSSFFCPNNYVIYRSDRTHAKGGGTLLLVKNTVVSKPLELDNNSSIDAVACELLLADNTNIGLLCVYRPPGLTADDNSKLYSIMNTFLDFKLKFNVIVGDFNFPDIQWPDSTSSSQSDAFLYFLQDNFLQQHVRTPTRRASQSILDLVLTTQGTDILNLMVNEEFGSSDHSIIDFVIPTKPIRTKKKIKRRNLRRADWARFQDLLTSSDWSSVFNTDDIDEVWDRFCVTIHTALDSVAPIYEFTIRNSISNSKIRTALRYKRRCYKALVHDCNLSNVVAYERASAIANRAINNEITERENRVLCDTTTKSFWSYVNCRLSQPPRVNSLMLSGTVVDDLSRMSNIFNDYFASNFTVTDSSGISRVTFVDSLEPVALHSVSVCTDDVMEILRHLPAKTSTDINDLSYKILKEGGVILATHLTKLFSLSLLSCRIPSVWKIGIVTPIHKKGAKNIVSNYRPISVTSCCGRVLERIVRNKISMFLSAHHKISPSQHGFTAKRSTDTILLKFYDYVSEAIDHGQAVDSIFFDFSKAFDTIPHDKLILRLRSCGITGNILLWIHDFLTNRQQKVRLDDVFSTLLPVTSGVIQGSVLGPTLFNVFINSIDTVIKHSHILKYADDIRIYLASDKSCSALLNLQSKLQFDIDKIVDWASNSGMFFNITKCFCASFGLSSTLRTYSILDKTIPNKSTFKDLGVTVSTPLSFNNHMDHIVSRAFARLGLVHKIFHTKSKYSILRLFKAYVRPILDFSCIIWNPYTAKYIKKIDRVQRRLCRMIPAIRYLPYREQLKHLGLYSLETRRLRFQLISIFKLLNRFTDINFYSFFKTYDYNKTRGHRWKIIPQYAKHNYRQHFFTNSSIHLWNKLSDDDVSVQTISCFKSRIDSFFIKENIW